MPSIADAADGNEMEVKPVLSCIAGIRFVGVIINSSREGDNANLTDDDLLFKEGKEEGLLGRLEKKLGKSKEELRTVIAKL
jgi:hypothetical protein